jgi:hypothetical protein
MSYAIDLRLPRSLIVRENEAGAKVDVTRIDNDPLALCEALGDAGEHPDVAIEAAYGWYWAVDVLEEMGASVHLVNLGPKLVRWAYIEAVANLAGSAGEVTA